MLYGIVTVDKLTNHLFLIISKKDSRLLKVNKESLISKNSESMKEQFMEKKKKKYEDNHD